MKKLATFLALVLAMSALLVPVSAAPVESSGTASAELKGEAPKPIDPEDNNTNPTPPTPGGDPDANQLPPLWQTGAGIDFGVNKIGETLFTVADDSTGEKVGYDSGTGVQRLRSVITNTDRAIVGVTDSGSTKKLAGYAVKDSSGLATQAYTVTAQIKHADTFFVLQADGMTKTTDEAMKGFVLTLSPYTRHSENTNHVGTGNQKALFTTINTTTGTGPTISAGALSRPVDATPSKEVKPVVLEATAGNGNGVWAGIWEGKVEVASALQNLKAGKSAGTITWTLTNT